MKIITQLTSTLNANETTFSIILIRTDYSFRVVVLTVPNLGLLCLLSAFT